MRRLVLRCLAACAICAVVTVPAVAAPPSCDALQSLKLADTATLEVHSVSSGQFTPPGARARAIDSLPPFCAVRGVLKPTPQSSIQFEVWLPETNWNGKLQVVGNGGLAGTISYPAMASALRDGFATASTDTGHTAAEPAAWLENRGVLGRPLPVGRASALFDEVDQATESVLRQVGEVTSTSTDDDRAAGLLRK